MKRSFVFWILAFAITMASAYYQRRTGPTYPIRDNATVNAKRFSYRLERSHGGKSNCPVQIKTSDPAVSGTLEWRRHGVDEAWINVPMVFNNGTLEAELPHQPPAGKLDYRVVLRTDSENLILPAGNPAVIRFKGDVSSLILYPHILAMFVGMLLSTRAGLEFFNPQPRLKALIWWTLGCLLVGGGILGPIIQKYAFGAYWTGWPFGIDLTDNKTAVALLGWVLAARALYKSKRPEIWAAIAAIMLLAVYMIPHSVLGSELDYKHQKQPRISSIRQNVKVLTRAANCPAALAAFYSRLITLPGRQSGQPWLQRPARASGWQSRQRIVPFEIRKGH